MLEGLLAGLAHGEQHGIVHRDLKPENLMVTSDGRVKIADFGIAKATNQMQTGAFLTATGTTVGTPTYMAPEQAMAQDIGPPTDLYSVGCMAFEMFTGRVPFHDTEAPMAILLRHVNEQIPSVKSIDPKIDEDISDWIERMLVKDPTKRTQNANDAWDEFEEIIIGLLGPRWRREARLREGSAQFDTPAPLTPAPFEGTTSDAAVSDQFQSFAWGNAVTPDGAPRARHAAALGVGAAAARADRRPAHARPRPRRRRRRDRAGLRRRRLRDVRRARRARGAGGRAGRPAAAAEAEAARGGGAGRQPTEPDGPSRRRTRRLRDLHRARAAAPADRRRADRGARDPGARAGPRAGRRRAAAATAAARAGPGAAAAPTPPRPRRRCARSTRTTTSPRRSCRPRSSRPRRPRPKPREVEKPPPRRAEPEEPRSRGEVRQGRAHRLRDRRR